VPAQLTFADVRPRGGPQLTVLPDAARVEERLQQLARAQGFVAGRVACSVADLERELVREARRSGSCPAPASPAALLLALREAARGHSHGPFFSVRDQPGYARALGDLLAALAQGLLEPAELLSLEVPERVAALARTLVAARALLDGAGLAEPHRAVRAAVEAVERGGPLPPLLARVAGVRFEGILDWTPLRLRLVRALSARLRVRVRLPWSPGKPDIARRGCTSGEILIWRREKDPNLPAYRYLKMKSAMLELPPPLPRISIIRSRVRFCWSCSKMALTCCRSSGVS